MTEEELNQITKCIQKCIKLEDQTIHVDFEGIMKALGWESNSQNANILLEILKKGCIHVFGVTPEITSEPAP